ncbi:MAG: thioredoxin-dependent thiol peroxidase [Rhodospirillales bacterium]|nr:thioredoxin-dependent thiol peroxidase [Rhodospirillales bacterium]
MSELKIGDTAPDFTAPTDGDGELSLSSFKGQNVVLYFYPKDDTPGCTTESCGFNEALQAFKKLGATVIGVSKDSPQRHDKFKTKYGLNFPLVSDENSDICERYGVWKEKNMYGKKYMGIERSTFLIDARGKIAAIWRKVKVNGHVDEIRAAIEDLAKAA